MKYLMTGANGYIGTRVARSILEQGNNVVFIVRAGAAGSPHLAKVLADFPETQYEILAYDGTADNLLYGAKDVDRVIHLAAFFKNGHDPVTASELVMSNIKYSMDLFTAIAEVAPKAHVVAASTWSAYGENGEYAPQNLYSATKKVIEDLAVTLPLDITFLRFSDTYGPGDWRRKIVNIFRDALYRGEEFTFGSPASQEIYLLHVEDIVRAIDHAFELDEPGIHGYDLFYPENKLTLREVAEAMVSSAGAGQGVFPNQDAPKPLPPQVDIMPEFKLSKIAKDHIAEVMGE